MSSEGHVINDESLRATRYEQVAELFRRAYQLPDSDITKRELLQVLASRVLQLCAVQCEDWNTIDQWFNHHCEVGFTRKENRIAMELLHAECALDYADDVNCREAIQKLECTLEEFRGVLNGHDQAVLESNVKDLWHELSCRRNDMER